MDQRDIDAHLSLLSPPFVAESPAMRKVLDDLRIAAERDATILLLGETGSGKDVLAALAHRLSPRRSGPFITLDCGSIVPTLMEAEIFGHAKGVFTGAHTQRIGLVEAANRGRLFLNEVGDSSPDLQKCFLDLVQYKRFRKVGEIDYSYLDVAFIAATHRDLRRLAGAGTFRLDLYHRLRVFEIRIPPLRDRREEIPDIVRTFLVHYAQHHSRSPVSIEDDALELLVRYPWPGNVRELAHAVECLVLRTAGDRIDRRRTAEFIDSVTDPPEGAAMVPGRREDTERLRIEEALRQYGGNKKHTAKALGMHRATLYRKLNRPGVLDADGP
jgi:DNA-binding NtrC family response regulator